MRNAYSVEATNSYFPIIRSSMIDVWCFRSLEGLLFIVTTVPLRTMAAQQ